MRRVYTLWEIDASLPVSERETRIQLPRREAKRLSQGGFKEEHFTPRVVSLLAILNKPDFTILPILFIYFCDTKNGISDILYAVCFCFLSISFEICEN